MDLSSCNILELQARRGIFEYIQSFPGLHVREISRRLEIPFTTLQYHLRYLEKRELIRGKEDSKYTRYYVSYQFGRKEKDILDLIRKKTPCSIIFYILIFVVASQSDLSKNLCKHKTTIEFHLKKMEKLGILKQVKSEYGVIKFPYKPYMLEHTQVGNEILYALSDPYIILDLLITNKESLLDDDVFRQMVDYINYMVSTGVPDTMASPRDAEDKLADFFWALFPPFFRA
jgi:DNA-binding MarR family transcriptional regulator